jgi:hypothetical protein
MASTMKSLKLLEPLQRQNRRSSECLWLGLDVSIIKKGGVGFHAGLRFLKVFFISEFRFY